MTPPTWLELLVAMAALTPDEREVFLDHHLCRRDWRDIAATVGKSPAWCRVLEQRAVRRLQIVLDARS